MEEKYFAAQNSPRGFISYYGDAFGGAERRYIVKGGPGTGKSYFLRRIAERAEGEGFPVVYIYCSSDPLSLDGIIIDKRFALFDGTAPHAEEARCPGARDELIDLGRFWKDSVLRERRAEIEALSECKSSSYARAYDCLCAVGSVEKAIARLIVPCVKKDKLLAAAKRYLQKLPDDGSARITNLAVNSIGMRGEVRFSTLEDNAVRAICVSDVCHTAYIFFDALIREGMRKGLRMRISHDPFAPEHADAVEFSDFGLVFYLGAGDVKRVNMQRFLDGEMVRSVRRAFRELSLCRASLISAAKSALEEVKVHHFDLEKIYIRAMDFDAKDLFTESFADSLMLALRKKV